MTSPLTELQALGQAFDAIVCDCPDLEYLGLADPAPADISPVEGE